jgi:cytochrome c oxidase cbb3-type subunit III
MIARGKARRRLMNHNSGHAGPSDNAFLIGPKDSKRDTIIDEFIDEQRPETDSWREQRRSLLAVAGGLVALLLIGIAAATFYAPRQSEVPERIRLDPLLMEGRQLYLDRCLSCHGDQGRGDGPIARSIQGPPPGDLTDNVWKHGSRPDQILRVIQEGIDKTSMPAWKGPFTNRQTQAVAAYVFELANLPIPDDFRTESPD